MSIFILHFAIIILRQEKKSREFSPKGAFQEHVSLKFAKRSRMRYEPKTKIFRVRVAKKKGTSFWRRLEKPGEVLRG
jgi:hypothetical protein